MRLPRDESGGAMLARPKLGDGRPCLPDRPRRIVAAASKDVGTGAPARPVERSSTSGTNCRCRVRSLLRRADEGVRPYVNVLILPDFVFRFMTGEFGRLA